MKKFTVYKAILPSHGWVASLMYKMFPNTFMELIDCDHYYLDMEGSINCIDADNDSKKRFPLGFYMGAEQHFGVKEDQQTFETAVEEERERMAVQAASMLPPEEAEGYG